MSISEPGNLSGLMRDFEHNTPHPIAGTDALTAAIEMTKDRLGIVGKPERSISDPTVQRDGLWQYEATSNNPLLEHLVNFYAVEENVLGEKDESYKEHLKELYQGLPATINARLEYESTLPFQIRDPEYQEFQNALLFTAQTLAWLDGVTKLHEPNDLQLARQLISSELPIAAFKTSLQDTSSILESARDYLVFVGPNNPNFDKLINYVSQIGIAHSNVTLFADKLSSSNLSDTDISDLKNLSKKLTALKESIQHTDIGNELRILDPTLSSLTAVASALSLPDVSATLVIGLLLSNSHLSQSDSALGFLNDGFLKSNSILSRFIVETIISPNKNDPGSRIFFPSAANTLLVSIATAAATLAEIGFGIIPENSESTRSFSLLLALNFISGSQFFETIFQTVAAASGANDQNAKTISQIYSTTALFLSTLIASRGDEDMLKKLIFSIDSRFTTGIESIESYVDEQINNGTIQNEYGRLLHAYLLQARSSLESENIAQFIQAYSGIFQSLIQSDGDLDKDIQSISEFSQSIMNALKDSSDTELNPYGGYVQS